MFMCRESLCERLFEALAVNTTRKCFLVSSWLDVYENAIMKPITLHPNFEKRKGGRKRQGEEGEKGGKEREKRDKGKERKRDRGCKLTWSSRFGETVKSQLS